MMAERGIQGMLSEMCSREEAEERERLGQLHPFERQPDDDGQLRFDRILVIKRFQRSAAGRVYSSQEVRTMSACWRTVTFLVENIFDLDKVRKPAFAVSHPDFTEVYSYIHDRLRAVRVDLHVQRPWALTQLNFVAVHECCLRAEMLSFFLLSGMPGGESAECRRFCIQAVSQSISPLMDAYSAWHQVEASAWPLGADCPPPELALTFEPALQRYVILLLTSFSPLSEAVAHVAGLARSMMEHPTVQFAIRALAAFRAGDYRRFLRYYKAADFMTAVAMSRAANLARARILWSLSQSYPKSVGDQIPLPRAKTMLAIASDEHLHGFLVFFGLAVATSEERKGGDGDTWAVLPKKSAPGEEASPWIGTSRQEPEACNYDGEDSLLDAKLEVLGLSRSDIIFGHADLTLAACAEV